MVTYQLSQRRNQHQSEAAHSVVWKQYQIAERMAAGGIQGRPDLEDMLVCCRGYA